MQMSVQSPGMSGQHPGMPNSQGMSQQGQSAGGMQGQAGQAISTGQTLAAGQAPFAGQSPQQLQVSPTTDQKTTSSRAVHLQNCFLIVSNVQEHFECQNLQSLFSASLLSIPTSQVLQMMYGNLWQLCFLSQ